MTNNTKLEQLQFPIGHFIAPKKKLKTQANKWITILETFPLQLKSVAQNLSVEELNWQYRPDGWRIKQVIHHLADSHCNSFIRFKLALTETIPVIKPYNETLWAELTDSKSDTIDASLQIIKGIHQRWVLLLKSLSEKELQKQFVHPENQKTQVLYEMMAYYAWHCNHHFAHIELALRNKGKYIL